MIIKIFYSDMWAIFRVVEKHDELHYLYLGGPNFKNQTGATNKVPLNFASIRSEIIRYWGKGWNIFELTKDEKIEYL